MNNSLKLISTLTHPIRWVDLDAYGHVNNSKYFDYMSEARIVLFDDAFLASKIHYVVAETHCIYKKSFHYPGNIIIKQYLKELGHASMVFYYVFYLEGDTTQTIYAECTTKIVCVDPHADKIVRLPDSIYAKLK